MHISSAHLPTGTPVFHFTSGHYRIVWLEWRGVNMAGGVLRALLCGDKYPLDLSCCTSVKIGAADGLMSCVRCASHEWRWWPSDTLLTLSGRLAVRCQKPLSQPLLDHISSTPSRDLPKKTPFYQETPGEEATRGPKEQISKFYFWPFMASRSGL